MEFPNPVNREENERVIKEQIDSYMEHLDEMLKDHKGEWTVFRESKPLGFWHCIDDAFEAGYSKYGNSAFLIRQVSDEYKIYGKYGKPVILATPFLVR